MNWSAEETEQLKTLYCQEGIDAKKIAEILNKTLKSVQSKIERLRLKKRPYWLPEEIEYLEELIGEMPLKRIPRAYNKFAQQNGFPLRTEAAILAKVYNSRVRRRNRTGGDWLASADIAAGLGIGQDTPGHWMSRYKDILSPEPLWDSGQKLVVNRKNLRKFFLTYPEIVERYQKKLDIRWLIDLLVES